MKDIAVYNTNQIDGRKTIEKLISLGYSNRMGLSGSCINFWYFTKNGEISGVEREEDLPENINKIRATIFLKTDNENFSKINSHGYKVGDSVRLTSPMMGTSQNKKLTVVGFGQDSNYSDILVKGMNNGHDGCGHTAYDENGKVVNLNKSYIYYWLGKEDIKLFYGGEKVYGEFKYDLPTTKSNESKSSKELVKDTKEKTFILTQTTLVTVNQNE